MKVSDRRRVLASGRPVARRAVTADRYWQLRHLVSEALRARDRAQYAHAAHLAAQAKVDELLAALGLDPAQEYTFQDAELTLTPTGAPPGSPVTPSELMREVPGPRSPLSMLDDE